MTAAGEALDAPPAFLAVPLLSVLSAGVGASAQLRLKRSWREPATLWTAVVRILEENPQGVLLARDEPAAWLGSFDHYAHGAADLQFWIEVWGGEQVSLDRMGERPGTPVTWDSPRTASPQPVPAPFPHLVRHRGPVHGQPATKRIGHEGESGSGSTSTAPLAANST